MFSPLVKNLCIPTDTAEIWGQPKFGVVPTPQLLATLLVALFAALPNAAATGRPIEAALPLLQFAFSSSHARWLKIVTAVLTL